MSIIRNKPSWSLSLFGSLPVGGWRSGPIHLRDGMTELMLRRIDAARIEVRSADPSRIEVRSADPSRVAR